ncbi:DUF421 domain-containing protein [Krasilnikovia sp. M28-CT-15]|uniref:DUF421 domain-containing protein n=1 Tax=Krasilnikovia sp. M28-CT-15 TaxID=3373540 RepID=UPI003876669A
MRLGMSWADALTVVAAAAGVYLAFLVMIRVVGQQALAATSSFDLAATTALGAVVGRAVLGYTPTLTAGVVGMATLLALQAAFGMLRRSHRLDQTLGSQPLLLMADGVVLPEKLRRARIAEDELRQRLREAGIRRYDDVAAVILERTGTLSILRQGETIAPELISDVPGHELLADKYIRG